MPDELEKINDIFRLHEEIERTAAQKKIEESALHAAVGKTGVQNAAGKTSKTAAVEQDEYYDEDELTERDYRPVRRGREYRSGCLGGVMYFVFIICVSIILACVAWMSAADALALNKDLFTAEVTLPANIFTTKTVETMDEDGTVTKVLDRNLVSGSEGEGMTIVNKDGRPCIAAVDMGPLFVNAFIRYFDI